MNYIVKYGNNIDIVGYVNGGIQPSRSGSMIAPKNICVNMSSIDEGSEWNIMERNTNSDRWFNGQRNYYNGQNKQDCNRYYSD